VDEDPVLYRRLSQHLNDILKKLGEQWDELIAQLQSIIDALRSGAVGAGDAPADLPEHCAPFLRTVLDAVFDGQMPTPAEALRVKDVTVEIVDLLVQELQSNRGIWSPHKLAAQEDLNTQLFEHLMRLRPPLVNADKAGVLADKLMEQARANHTKLLQV
jgi:type I restriction enzyme R subunit